VFYYKKIFTWNNQTIPTTGLKLLDILGIAFVFGAHYCLEKKIVYFNNSEAGTNSCTFTFVLVKLKQVNVFSLVNRFDKLMLSLLMLAY
jgi:hypothetical protein